MIPSRRKLSKNLQNHVEKDFSPSDVDFVESSDLKGDFNVQLDYQKMDQKPIYTVRFSQLSLQRMAQLNKKLIIFIPTSSKRNIEKCDFLLGSGVDAIVMIVVHFEEMDQYKTIVDKYQNPSYFLLTHDVGYGSIPMIRQSIKIVAEKLYSLNRDLQYFCLKDDTVYAVRDCNEKIVGWPTIMQILLNKMEEFQEMAGISILPPRRYRATDFKSGYLSASVRLEKFVIFRFSNELKQINYAPLFLRTTTQRGWKALSSIKKKERSLDEDVLEQLSKLNLSPSQPEENSQKIQKQFFQSEDWRMNETIAYINDGIVKTFMCHDYRMMEYKTNTLAGTIKN